MRGKRKDLPATREGMEQYLLAAVARVKEGSPENPDLAVLAKKGKLKANPTTVAKEAGVSRSLFAYKECRYPNVRRAICGKDAADDQLPIRVPTDMRAINADLKQINRILEQRLRVSISEQAAMLNRMRKLENEYHDKAAEIKRIESRADRSPNEVVGLHVVRPIGKP
ncbi:hypothetical protein [Janthinobacterium sp. 64]|uniref:hypothetical protein n=1 Tax=Janthinobacterium sp. 64 TaxID=2035208 RepID=UPI000C2B5A6B|nr:hypothetical protein [Janthinobacterium sp. 64]PKB24103.1 hypothetical protein CLU91_4572 [Janthinobacterium sp. 64]